MLSIEPVRGELVGSRYQRPSWATPVHFHPVWDLPRVPRKLPLPREPVNEAPPMRRPEMGEPSQSPRGEPQPPGYGPPGGMPGGPPPFHGMPPQHGYGPPPGMHMGPDGYGMGMPQQGMQPDMWHGGPGPMRHGKGGGKGGNFDMGKGKGGVDHWVAQVKAGSMLYEMDGVDRDLAKEAMRLASSKLPIPTRFVVREEEI